LELTAVTTNVSGALNVMSTIIVCGGIVGGAKYTIINAGNGSGPNSISAADLIKHCYIQVGPGSASSTATLPTDASAVASALNNVVGASFDIVADKTASTGALTVNKGGLTLSGSNQVPASGYGTFRCIFIGAGMVRIFRTF